MIGDRMTKPSLRLSDEDGKHRRSRSFDSGMLLSAETRTSEAESFRQQKRHSIDILDNDGSHINASPEQIRELLAVNKDKSDMPSRTPPPVPRLINRKSQIEDVSLTAQIPPPGKTKSKGQDYEFMSPQVNPYMQVPLHHEQQNQDSDSGVDSPQLRRARRDNQMVSSDPNIAEDVSQTYVRMNSGSPKMIRRDLDLGDGKFSRSRSAHTINWSRQQDASAITPSTQKYNWEEVTTVARSKFTKTKDGGGERPRGRRTLQKNSRMSRSVEDLLSAGAASGEEFGGLKEAESLRDILARTYAVPAAGEMVWQDVLKHDNNTE